MLNDYAIDSYRNSIFAVTFVFTTLLFDKNDQNLPKKHL